MSYLRALKRLRKYQGDRMHPIIMASDLTEIIAHNHPSGSLEPSKNDVKLTHKIEKAGELIGVKLLDDLIITKDSFYSLTDSNCF